MEDIENTNYQVNILGEVRNKKTGKILKNYLSNGYYCVDLGKQYNIHRLIALQFIPNPENLSDVDHIDGNKINNSIENLRWTSHQQNNMNLKIYSNNKSGFSGVGFHKAANRWQARIRVNKPIFLGLFDTAELAHEARQKYILDNKILMNK